MKIEVITNSWLQQTKLVELFGSKWFLYYINLHGYNDVTVTTKYYWWSIEFVVTEFDILKKWIVLHSNLSSWATKEGADKSKIKYILLNLIFWKWNFSLYDWSDKYKLN